jgi:hypothetical protein
VPGLSHTGGCNHRAGLDIGQYRFDARTPSHRCPHCQAVLDRVTPLIALGPGWLWQINNEWLTVQLDKARGFDQTQSQTG